MLSGPRPGFPWSTLAQIARAPLLVASVRGTLCRMNRASSRVALFIGLALVVMALLAGCGPRWAILAQATPDPLVGAKAFFIEPIHYDPPVIGAKSEPDYLAGTSPDQQDSWRTDKSETSKKYAEALIGAIPEVHFLVQPAPGVFIVRPIVSFIEPGFYAGFVARATEVQMRIQILASDGAIVDDIAVRSLIGASLVYPASGTRLRMAGEDLGRVTADYLRKRVTGGAG